MSADNLGDQEAILEIRQEIDDEDRRALARARVGLGIRLGLIAFVVAYMMWLSGAIGHLSAPELTRLAAAQIEERLPELRAEIRDYAIGRAPEITDQAQKLLLEMPTQLRTSLEGRLQREADEWIRRLGDDVDLALTSVIDQQLELVQEALPGATPEEQLDAFILGVSDLSRQTMIASLDEIYEGYTGEVQQLNAYLQRLQTGEDLSEAEMLDRELIEIWMVLVHQHGIAQPEKVVDNLKKQF